MVRIPYVAMAGLVALAAAALVGCRQSWQSELMVEDGRNPVWSPDGTQLAFQSWASHVPGDTNDQMDVYLHDLKTGATTLLSSQPDGVTAGTGGSYDPVFSPDRTKVAFTSTAADLGSKDTNDTYDVYVRNLRSGRTTLLSANDRRTAGNGMSLTPVFSSDSAQVAFISAASDLGPTDGNGTIDVYLRSLRTGRLKLVSVDGAGTDSGNGQSESPVFSADGTQVAFDSTASDLGPLDTNGSNDVYLRNLVSRTTTLVSVNAAGTDSGNGGSGSPVLSPDATNVAFTSAATDLGPLDTAGTDVYVRDLVTGMNTLVSVNTAGTGGGDRGSVSPVFSPDGTKIAFNSEASDLGPPDTGTNSGDSDVYLRDLTTASTTLVSVNASGTDAGNDVSADPVFNSDGRLIAFTSLADDLGPTDTNNCQVKPTDPQPHCSDIYVRDLVDASTSLASASAGDSLPRTESRDPLFAPGDGTRLAFWTVLGGPESIYVATVEAPSNP